MKKYRARVYRRTSALSNEWHREKDLIIYARNEASAYKKLDKIGRNMASDYCRIEARLEEVEQ